MLLLSTICVSFSEGLTVEEGLAVKEGLVEGEEGLVEGEEGLVEDEESRGRSVFCAAPCRSPAKSVSSCWHVVDNSLSSSR